MTKVYWPDNTIYFLTGATFIHHPYFREDKQKQIVLNQIKKIKKNLNIPISAYSIAINHYHLEFYLEKGLDLTRIKQLMHGGTTFEYKKEYSMKYTDMWQSSKVFQVTSEEMYWNIMGYTIGNLLKHKEVSTFDELKNNPFSSYNYIAAKYGDEFAQELVYSVIGLEENSEGIVDLSKLGTIKIVKPSAKAE